jgi:DNA-binding transcriptional LysR family regulator
MRKIPDLSTYDLRLLHVFDAVVAAGSFTAAEIALNKSKSAISMDIAALETRLGVKLCRRGRAGFGLTEYGKKIHAASRELFSGLSDFRDRVGRIVSRVEGEFSLAIDDNFHRGLRNSLLDALRSFTLRNPDIFLTVRSSSAEHVTQLVLDGSVDVGINVIPRIVPEMRLHPLFQERMQLYCGARHPLFAMHDSKIAPDVLSHYGCIDVVTRQNPKICKLVERMLIKARAPTVPSRLLLIRTGNYLGFLPSDYARTWEARGEIRHILPQICCESTGYAIARRDAAPNAARELFIEELQRVLRDKGLLPMAAETSTEAEPTLAKGKAKKIERRPVGPLDAAHPH